MSQDNQTHIPAPTASRRAILTAAPAQHRAAVMECNDAEAWEVAWDVMSDRCGSKGRSTRRPFACAT
jgi:hypothetical protein